MDDIEINGDINFITVEPPVLGPGDILHIQVGIDNMGDGMGPWIPGPEDLERVRAAWEAIVPEGIKVIVTNRGEVPEVINVEDGGIDG